MLPTARDDQPRSYSEETAAQIDTAVRRLVDDAYGLSRRILAMNERLLRESAANLLDHETLAGAELDAVSAVVNRGAVEPPRLPAPPQAAE